MARLHEYQGKALLRDAQIPIPRGGPANSPKEAKAVAEEIGDSVVVKAQAWVTGRAGLGAIRFADTPEQAFQAADDILGTKIDGFSVDTVLVEERLEIEREFFASVIIDDQAQAPLIIFSRIGGTGIEQIVQEHPDAVARRTIDIRSALLDHQARDLVRKTDLHGKLQLKLATLLVRLYAVAHRYDARVAEINPLALTTDGELVAVDCRITLDDYAVYRHPELGIEIAREFDRPPTPLERIAWEVEKNDYRGTFYFIQLKEEFKSGEGVIGFHGAGGGGSMMSMDAVLNQGYTLANYVDTSGNPPASKVYRAARIILAQKGIDGYFASGSGVASQEQFHSARGLVKAFLEVPLTVPAIIRLGGNAEERAIEILARATEAIPAPVEGYGKDNAPEFCAERLNELIKAHKPRNDEPPGRTKPEPQEPYRFETVTGGMVTLDHSVCKECATKFCVESCVPQILELKDDVPVLNISLEQAKKGGCTECLACDIECYFEGERGGFVALPIPGLDELAFIS
ncbi:MAG: succinyl-CoA synthetase subunit beta [Anaerolineales bacterium]|nr:succinyl-CoA synthetase subunit beta [Anaerolineales bacterium]